MLKQIILLGGTCSGQKLTLCLRERNGIEDRSEHSIATDLDTKHRHNRIESKMNLIEILSR